MLPINITREWFKLTNDCDTFVLTLNGTMNCREVCPKNQ